MCVSASKSHGISQHGNEVELENSTRLTCKLKCDWDSTELHIAERLHTHAPTHPAVHSLGTSDNTHIQPCKTVWRMRLLSHVIFQHYVTR